MPRAPNLHFVRQLLACDILIECLNIHSQYVALQKILDTFFVISKFLNLRNPQEYQSVHVLNQNKLMVFQTGED